jgi:hypothetical protein
LRDAPIDRQVLRPFVLAPFFCWGGRL